MAFVTTLSARENVEFVCRIYGAHGRDMQRKVDFVREFAEIGEYFDLPMKSFSSGMRSRVAFGLSMAFDFDYYLIDEVMAVGDAQFRKKSREVLKERLERANLILTSHNMADIRQYCNLVVLVDRGNTVLLRRRGGRHPQLPGRHRKHMKFLIRLSPRTLKLVIIGLPLLLVALYLGLFAADRYVSESTLAVRQAGSEGVALPGAAMLLAGLTPPSREDTLYVQHYIHSLGLLRKLDSELKIREHFAAPRHGPAAPHLARVQPGGLPATFPRPRRGDAIDDVSSLLTVRAQGFDPAFAQRLNQRILEESERFVNEYSHRIAREKLTFAEAELKTAAQRVQQAKNQVLAFQTRNRLLDPIFQAQASGALSAELQATQGPPGGRAERPAGLHERRRAAGARPAHANRGDRQAGRRRTRARHQAVTQGRTPQQPGDRVPGPADAGRIRHRCLQDRAGCGRERAHRRHAQAQEPGGDRAAVEAGDARVPATPVHLGHGAGRQRC